MALVLALICGYLVLHSYVVYPLILRLLTVNRHPKKSPPSLQVYPRVSVLVAARNEEAVLQEKIESLFGLHYPKDQLEVIIGSDASTDATDEIVKAWDGGRWNVIGIRSEQRIGKSAMLNKMLTAASGEWLLLTDANVLHHPDALQHLLHTAQLRKAVLVGAEIHYINEVRRAVAEDEDRFLRFENRLKHAESELWNLVIGVEGGCFLIHRNAMPVVPEKALVDDFFITMSVLENKGKVVWDPQAIAYEDVSTQASEEYRRKVRISTGNFQNLFRFKHLLWKRPFPLGFAFLSHKVLRWFTPMLIVTSMGSIAWHWAFSNPSLFIQTMAALLFAVLILISPARHWPLLRSLRHGILMNIALLEGLILHLTKRGPHVWEPTKRKQ